MFVKLNDFIYIPDANSHILCNFSLGKSLVMRVKHSFLIRLWESLSIIVNSVLLVETESAFTVCAGKKTTRVDKIFTGELLERKQIKTLTSMIHRCVCHFISFLLGAKRAATLLQSVVGSLCRTIVVYLVGGRAVGKAMDDFSACSVATSAVVRCGSNDSAIEHVVDLSISGRIWEKYVVYHVKFYSFRSWKHSSR